MASSVITTDFHGSFSTFGNLEAASNSTSNKTERKIYSVSPQNLPSVYKSKRDLPSNKQNVKENLKASSSMTAETGASKSKSKEAPVISKTSYQDKKLAIKLIVNTKEKTCRFKNEVAVKPSTTTTSSTKSIHRSRKTSDSKIVPLIERNSGNLRISASDFNFSSSIAEKVKLKKRGQGQDSNVDLYHYIRDNSEMPRKRRRKCTSTLNHDYEISSPESKTDSTDDQALYSSNFDALAVNQIKDNLLSDIQSAGSSPLYSTLDSTTFCEILLDKLSVDDLTLKDTPCPVTEMDKSHFFDFIKKEDEILSISTLSEILPESAKCSSSLNVTVNNFVKLEFESDSAVVTEPNNNVEKIHPKACPTYSPSVKQEVDCKVFVTNGIDCNFDLDSIAMEVEVSTEAENKYQKIENGIMMGKRVTSSFFQNLPIELPSCSLKKNNLSENIIPINKEEQETCGNSLNDDRNFTIKTENVKEHGYSLSQLSFKYSNSTKPLFVNKKGKIDNAYSKVKSSSLTSLRNNIGCFMKTSATNEVDNSQNSQTQREENENNIEKRRQNFKAMEERRVVYIGGLPKQCTVGHLQDMFMRYGPIEDVRVRWKECDSASGYEEMQNGDITKTASSSRYGMSHQNSTIAPFRKKYFGFVTFKEKADADFAVFDAEKKWPNFDVRFGGRRRFVGEKYTDLDEKREETESTNSKGCPKSFDEDYSAMLRREIHKRGLEFKRSKT